MTINRVIVIVLDSVGIGEAPDAAAYGDVGSHTLGNMARVVGGLNVPQYGDEWDWAISPSWTGYCHKHNQRPFTAN